MAPEVKSKTRKAEIVIIGGGASGLSAGLAAVENGVDSVIILEKGLNTGGNGLRAHGMFAAESHLQRKALIDASCDEIYKLSLKWHHYSRIRPKVLRAYINKSGDTIRWLEEKGIEFTVGSQNRTAFNQIPVWHIEKSRGSFAVVMEALTIKCKEAGIEILLRTSGKKITRDGRGRITGVLAKTRGEKEFEIRTGSVVISTGGFAGNKKLLKKYFPFYDDTFFNCGMPHKGDGIQLAADAGAAIEDCATMIKEGHFTDFKTPTLFSLIREPYTVWVNKKGERFIDETAGIDVFQSGNITIQQPGRIWFALFDDAIRQDMEENGFLLGRPGVPRGSAGEPLPGLKEDFQSDAYSKWVKIADSWDEIAHHMGADPRDLKRTINEYNVFCDRGYDETFVKDPRYLLPLCAPPYYAIKVRPMITDTIGPVRINEHMEILDNQDNPIPGLYAAGVIAGGWQSDEYCSELLGSAVSFAINSGRIAAENAVKYALGR